MLQFVVVGEEFVLVDKFRPSGDVVLPADRVERLDKIRVQRPPVLLIVVTSPDQTG
jgi:hypothetical protein